MNKIVRKQQLTPETALFEVEAPRIAKRWKPGQFIIVRPTSGSERIPLTIVDGNAERGTITMVVQKIGKTSSITVETPADGCFADVVGPLGEPAKIHKVGRVTLLAGGVGVAEVLPVAKAFKLAGNYTTVLAGARTDSLRILREELIAVADEVIWATDDGSFGFSGNVVQLLDATIKSSGVKPDLSHVIGPIPMMRAAAEATRKLGIKTYASVNPIMIDGTGMCGGCRVTVGGKVRFACVEGPEFDAHEVDFDELSRRTKAYRKQEIAAMEAHKCALGLHT
ncbi:MAG: sulfide/dihydroorotate dehydrogenase-like FAD/NAD-binding protein [Chthoniobacterales bacterium]